MNLQIRRIHGFSWRRLEEAARFGCSNAEAVQDPKLKARSICSISSRSPRRPKIIFKRHFQSPGSRVLARKYLELNNYNSHRFGSRTTLLRFRTSHHANHPRLLRSRRLQPSVGRWPDSSNYHLCCSCGGDEWRMADYF